MLHNLMEFVTPPLCPYCQQELLDQKILLCHDCAELMPKLPERLCPLCGGPNDGFLDICRECALADETRPWNRAVTAFPFHGHLREAIHHYKYHRRVSLAPFLAKQMTQAWIRHADKTDIDLVTYIPLHWRKLLHRGYNQAAILASLIAKQLKCPAFSTLRRRKATAQQAKLNREQRAKNVKNAFVPWHPMQFQARNVLLIDDVFTTGATLTAATNTILAAGAASVSVLTIARD